MVDIDYTKVEPHLMAGVLGTDAMKWATAFCQAIEKHNTVIDEELMLGWFANAIEQMRPVPLTEEEARGIAARIWGRPEMEHTPMDADLCAAFASVLQNGETGI